MKHDDQQAPSFWRSPAGLTLLIAIAAAGFYLLTEHTAHVFGALPYLLVLACPGWLGSQYPGVNLFGHDAGHLWWVAAGQQGNPHFGVLHLLSFVFLLAGFTLLSKAWHVLYHAQRRHQLAVAGPYRRIRHPQYVGFVAIMFGFLLQWPTLLTLVMFPVPVLVYLRLAIAEERDSEAAFGDAWRAYAALTPRFIPSLSQRDSHDQGAVGSH